MPHGKISAPYKRRAKHRIKILQGQLRGLERMIDDELYCMDILNQSLAVQESLKSLDALMLENHLREHAVRTQSSKSRESTVKELLRLFRLQKKNSR